MELVHASVYVPGRRCAHSYRLNLLNSVVTPTSEVGNGVVLHVRIELFRLFVDHRAIIYTESVDVVEPELLVLIP